MSKAVLTCTHYLFLSKNIKNIIFSEEIFNFYSCILHVQVFVMYRAFWDVTMDKMFKKIFKGQSAE